MKLNGMIIRGVCIILLSALSVATYSQKNLLPGTVITRGGDTLEGQIDYRNWSTNPDRARFSRESENLVVKTAILAGLSLTRIIFRSDSYQYLEIPEYKPSADFTGGLAVDLVFPRNFGKWSFNNELQWSSWSMSGESFASYPEGNLSYKWVYDLSASYLNINSMLRYNYTAGKVIIFMNAGISNGFLVAHKNHMDGEITEGSNVETITESYVEDIRKYEQAWLLGAGIRYGKILLEYRYERGNGISTSADIFSASRVNSIWLGYSF